MKIYLPVNLEVESSVGKIKLSSLLSLLLLLLFSSLFQLKLETSSIQNSVTSLQQFNSDGIEEERGRIKTGNFKTITVK